MNSDAHTLLTALGQDGYLSVCWKLPAAPTLKHAVVTLPEALATIDAVGDTADLWYGVNRMSDRPATGRGRAADITRITCLYADLDTGKPLTPSSITEARTIIDGLPEPMFIVQSGHGLQPIWPLSGDEFTTSDPAILHRWGQLIADRAAARGWVTDNVYDLARILRVPGTINHKFPDKPARARMEVTGGVPLTHDEVTEVLTEHERTRPSRTQIASSGPARPAASNHVVRGWLDTVAAFQQPSSVYGTEALAELLAEYGTREHSRHRWMVRSVTRVLELAATGHVDAHQALAQVRDRFTALIAGERPALVEFVAGVAWGVGQLTPTTSPATPATATLSPSGEPLPKYQPIDWQQLWDDTPEDEEWIIKPLLAAGRSIALYSAPKVGKSLLALEIAAAVSAGYAVLGQPAAPPRRVLYVDLENSRRDLKDRLIDLGYKPADLANLIYLSFPALPALDSPQGGQDLLDLAVTHEVELVVIDTVSRVIAGKESDADTFHALYRCALAPLKGLGVAVFRLDHAGKDAGKGQRGSSAKNGDVDAVWNLTAAGPALSLRCEMSRTQIDVQALSLKRLTDPLRHEITAHAAAVVDRVQVMMAKLDELGVPRDWGRPRCERALNQAAVPVDKSILEQAVRTRKSQLNLPDDLPGRSAQQTVSDNPGNLPEPGRAGSDETAGQTCPEDLQAGAGRLFQGVPAEPARPRSPSIEGSGQAGAGAAVVCHQCGERHPPGPCFSSKAETTP